MAEVRDVSLDAPRAGAVVVARHVASSAVDAGLVDLFALGALGGRLLRAVAVQVILGACEHGRAEVEGRKALRRVDVVH